MTSAQFASILLALAPIAEKQFADCEAKQIRAILENPAIAEKIAKTA